MSMSGRREHCTMIVKGDGVEFTIRRYLIRTKNSYYYFQSPALCVFFPYNPYNFCQDYPPAHNDTLKKIHRNTKAGKVLLNTFYSLIDGQMDGRGTLDPPFFVWVNTAFLLQLSYLNRSTCTKVDTFRNWNWYYNNSYGASFFLGAMASSHFHPYSSGFVVSRIGKYSLTMIFVSSFLWKGAKSQEMLLKGRSNTIVFV